MRRKILFALAGAVAALALCTHGPLSFDHMALLLVGGAMLDSLAGACGSVALTSVGGGFANLLGALKTRYDDSFLGAVGWSKGPLGAMIKKTAWSGKNISYPMRVGNSPA